MDKDLGASAKCFSNIFDHEPKKNNISCPDMHMLIHYI